ncbi:unnamed protein product [Caenorhabditis brenneri]
MRLTAHFKKSTIVGEKCASGVQQRPLFDGKASSGGRVKKRSELSKKDVKPIDSKEEIEVLSKKIQKQKQLASMLFLTVSKCSTISKQTAEELDESYIHLTHMNATFFVISTPTTRRVKPLPPSKKLSRNMKSSLRRQTSPFSDPDAPTFPTMLLLSWRT